MFVLSCLKHTFASSLCSGSFAPAPSTQVIPVDDLLVRPGRLEASEPLLRALQARLGEQSGVRLGYAHFGTSTAPGYSVCVWVLVFSFSV